MAASASAREPKVVALRNVAVRSRRPTGSFRKFEWSATPAMARGWSIWKSRAARSADEHGRHVGVHLAGDASRAGSRRCSGSMAGGGGSPWPPSDRRKSSRSCVRIRSTPPSVVARPRSRTAASWLNGSMAHHPTTRDRSDGDDAGGAVRACAACPREPDDIGCAKMAVPSRATTAGRDLPAARRGRWEDAVLQEHRDPRGVQPAPAARGLQRASPPTGRWPRRSRREGAAWASGDARGARCAGRRAGHPRARPAGQRQPSRAAYVRPFRAPHRRGRLPPRVPRAHADGHRARPARRPVVGSASRCARGPGGQGGRLVPGRGRARLSGVHDLLGGARPAAPAGARRARGSRPSRRRPTTRPTHRPRDKAGVTCGMALTEKQGGSDVRANTTRAEPIRSEPGIYRLIGPQVVLLGADVRRVPHAGPGPRRTQLLLGAALVPRRLAEPDPDPAAEGQAGRPFERIE